MRIYEIDFDRWIALMLPSMLRRRRVFAFCRAMCGPVRMVYDEFLSFRRSRMFILDHSGQVFSLRAALNEAFGLSAGFDIKDCDVIGGEWVFAVDEAVSVQLHACDENGGDGIPVLCSEDILHAPLNGFVVEVPGEIYDRHLEKVRAIVDRFRLPSKTPYYIRMNATGRSTSHITDNNPLLSQ